jgi:hypothetical protein
VDWILLSAHTIDYDIGGVMVSMLAWSVLERGLDPLVGSYHRLSHRWCNG